MNCKNNSKQTRSSVGFDWELAPINNATEVVSAAQENISKCTNSYGPECKASVDESKYTIKQTKIAHFSFRKG